MKKTCIMIAAIWLAGLIGGCAKHADVTLQINPDNTAKLSMVLTFDRAQLQQWADMSENAVEPAADEGPWDEGSEPVEQPKAETPADADAPTASAEDAKAAEQQEADAALRKFITDRVLADRSAGEHVKRTIENIELTENTAKVSVNWAFDDLKTCVAQWPGLLQVGGRLLLEKTDQDKLAITFTIRELPPNKKQLVNALRRMGSSGKFTVIAPGKVIESSLPLTEDNRTAAEYDTSDEPSATAAADLLAKPIRIVCEPGGIDLASLPLDSDVLYTVIDMTDSRGARPDPTDKLPLTDATSPYVAEATSVTSYQSHDYSGAAAFAEQLRWSSYNPRNQCQVQARMFPTAGRHIMSISTVKVDSAKDDQDRAIKPAANRSGYASYTSFDDEQADAPNQPVQFQVMLELPAADAKAVETIEGHVTAVVFDSWRTQRLEQVKPAPQTPIDLKDALPGATVTVRRMRTPKLDPASERGSADGVIQLRITGPEEIANLRITADVPRFPSVHAYPRTDITTTKDGRSIRDLNLQYSFWYDGDEPAVIPPPTLVIRYPVGLQRLRIPFTLEAVDLY